jgi:hypothetical protein
MASWAARVMARRPLQRIISPPAQRNAQVEKRFASAPRRESGVTINTHGGRRLG